MIHINHLYCIRSEKQKSKNFNEERISSNKCENMNNLQIRLERQSKQFISGLGFVRPKQVLERAVDKTWF